MKTCPVCDTPYPDQHANCPTDGALLIGSRELSPGYIVRGKYRILRKLGQGGMGVVYLAEHLLLGGHVALKFLAPELSRDPQFVKRFRNEARAAYQLHHPNIVDVTDLDQDEDGSLFIAMEYISGPSLRSVLHDSKGPLPVPRALAIAAGVAAGLSAAHARGAVHRDIKPDNILLATGPDGSEMAKVLDFGIAVMTDGVTNLSRTHGVLLTPQYAAPEQWRGMPAVELDGRTDLYALGGVLYEMLAGRTPFRAENMEGWMYEHLQGMPEPLERLRPDLAANYHGLDVIIMRLLARERELRFPSAATLVEALAFKPSGPDFMGPAEPVPIVEQVPATRHTRITKWVVATVLLMGGFGIWFASRFLPTKPATAIPVFAPSPGSYPEARPVAISDSTPGAIVHFTVDGSIPTPASPIYMRPLASLASGTVVRAMATVDGKKPSADVTGVYIWTGAAKAGGDTEAEGAGKVKGERGARVVIAPTKNGADVARSTEPKPVAEAGLTAEPNSGEKKADIAAQEEFEGPTWTDPATGLTWTRMDNANDTTWQAAMDFCQRLQFAGHLGWRLPTINELRGVYDSNVRIPGQCCNGLNVTWHVKGNMQLTGWQWSSSQGAAAGSAWGFNFDGGVPFASPTLSFADERALCVRRTGN